MPPPPITTAAAPSPSATADPIARARAGDLAALKALDRKPSGERSIEEALALETGHAALARAEAAELVRDLERDEKLFADAATLAQALRLALDPEVAPTLLDGLARAKSPVAADLLYDLVERADRGGRLFLLAEDLLASSAVRPEMSKALGIAWELRNAGNCEHVASLLARAGAEGDERATAALERVKSKTGCGPKSADDCWTCLRDGKPKEALETAVEAAAKRPAPRPWRTVKR